MRGSWSAIFVCTFLVISWGTLGCTTGGVDGDDDDDAADPCDGVTCSDHGTCVDNGGVAECDCDPEYHPLGLDCISDADPCGGQTCSDHGTCFENNEGQPECDCDIGYTTQGLECILENWPPDPDSLYDVASGCVVPECDQTGDPGYDPSGTWERTLSTTASDCGDLIQAFDARAQVGNVLTEDPAPLSTYSGNCAYNDEGDHTSTAFEGIVAKCESNLQSLDILSYETGIVTFTGDHGIGAAHIYLVDVPGYLGGNCDFAMDVEYQKLSK